MNQVSWTSILIGLALFLFGIDYLSLSLQELSPTRLKNLLAKCTSSTFKAILIGCFITCIIQSSSATTALTVSLINANLLTFSNLCKDLYIRILFPRLFCHCIHSILQKIPVNLA